MSKKPRLINEAVFEFLNSDFIKNWRGSTKESVGEIVRRLNILSKEDGILNDSYKFWDGKKYL